MTWQRWCGECRFLTKIYTGPGKTVKLSIRCGLVGAVPCAGESGKRQPATLEASGEGGCAHDTKRTRSAGAQPAIAVERGPGGSRVAGGETAQGVV